MSEKYCTVCGDPLITPSAIAAGRCQNCFEAPEHPAPNILSPEIGDKREGLTPNVADLGEVPANMPNDLKNWLYGEWLKPTWHDGWNNYYTGANVLWRKLFLEIDQLKDALQESRNDTAVFKEWWEKSKADIATLTEQRDANAQQALSYMEELTKAQTVLVKIGMLTNGVFEKSYGEELGGEGKNEIILKMVDKLSSLAIERDTMRKEKDDYRFLLEELVEPTNPILSKYQKK